MVVFTTVEHVVWSSKCVWALTTTVTTIWCAASLIVLGKSLIRGSRVLFLWRWPKILLPILWWPAAVRIDVVYWLWIVLLVVIVVRGPWGFV
jgi:hypothetical protein